MKKLSLFVVIFLGIFSLGVPTYSQTTTPHGADITFPASQTAGVTSYNVKRFVGACSASAVFTKIGTVTLPATLPTPTSFTYTDNNVTPGATYCYTVTALTAAGVESDGNGTIQGTIPVYTPSGIPQPPGAATVVTH